jgi:hypothetical protein
MTNRLLISVAAAALFAGTGLANAQGTGTSKEQPGGAATQHSAPSGGASSGAANRESSGMKGAEHSTEGESSGTKGAESEKGQPGASGKSVQETAPGQKSKSTEQETKGGKDMKAEGREKGGTVGETRDKRGGTESREKGGMETQKGATDNSRSQTTTGAATAGPPAEKRTQITSAIKSEKIEEATDVNVNLAVGTALPTSVRLHPLPPKIVEIYPEWRGYQVILVKGKYVIVKPETHEIVYIIEG